MSITTLLDPLTSVDKNTLPGPRQDLLKQAEQNIRELVNLSHRSAAPKIDIADACRQRKATTQLAFLDVTFSGFFWVVVLAMGKHLFNQPGFGVL